jgi:hypothetical protein
MRKQPTHNLENNVISDNFAGELLEVLLQEDTCYPWNHTDPETETYFAKLEKDFSLLDSLEADELASHADSFYHCLDKCWESAASLQVKESVFQRFGHLVPSNWIDAIATQATQLISENLSPIDRIVACVQPLLSHWGEEDLQVFARPLAYTMRGENTVKQAPWDELSEIEKVRFSMKIAQEVFAQLEETNQQ